MLFSLLSTFSTELHNDWLLTCGDWIFLKRDNHCSTPKKPWHTVVNVFKWWLPVALGKMVVQCPILVAVPLAPWDARCTAVEQAQQIIFSFWPSFPSLEERLSFQLSVSDCLSFHPTIKQNWAKSKARKNQGVKKAFAECSGAIDYTVLAQLVTCEASASLCKVTGLISSEILKPQ